MRKREIYIPSIVLLVTLLSLTLAGCVSVGGRWETKASDDYRDMGTGISSVADAVEDFCKGEAVTKNKCQSIRDMYNKMRQNYIDAGNTLKASIVSEINDSYYREKYNKEINQVTKDIQFIFKSMEG